MTNNKEKKGKEWGENVISHITFGFWQNIFHRSLARCTIASEWDSYVLPSPHPSRFWLLPVTVTTHTCKPDTLLSPPSTPPLNACQHWQSLFTTSHALFIKATHQFSSISTPCAWHMPCSLKDLSVKYSQINERYMYIYAIYAWEKCVILNGGKFNEKLCIC